MRILNSLFLIITLLSSTIIGPLSFNSDNLPGAFAETPNEITDISNYVVFGFEEVEIKKGVSIISGSVGVNNADSKVKLEKEVTFNDPNSSLVGDSVKIEKNSIAQNVFYNELENKGNILGSENTPLILPVVIDLPEFPDFEAGDEKIKVDKNESLILSPGDYGKIELKKDSTIIFEGGIYNVESIKVEKNSQILFEDSSEIRIEKEIKLDKETILGPSQTSDIDASDIVIFVEDGDVNFDKDSVINANIFAPNGEIKMDKGTTATGSFIANKVKIEKDSILTHDPPSPIPGLIDDLEIVFSNVDSLATQLNENMIAEEGEPSPETMVLLTLIETETKQISTLVEDLENNDAIVEAIVVEGSLIPTLLVIPAGLDPYEVTISNSACGFIMWANLLEFTLDEVALDGKQQVTLYLSSVDFCADVNSFSVFSTDPNLYAEGLLFMGSIAVGALDVISPDVDLVVSELNQIDLREHWLQIAFEFDNSTFLNADVSSLVQSYRPILAGTISGAVFNDSNQNMTFDSGEFGLSEWKVEASFSKPDGTKIIFNEITQGVPNEGEYAFDDLPTGIYTVKETLLPDHLQTSPVGDIYELNVVAGGDFTNTDFGNFQTAPPPPVITEHGWFTGSDARSNAHFGRDVVISGNTAVVSAYIESDHFLWRSGAVYVFEKIGNTWIQQDKLENPNPIESGLFGNTVAMSGDTILVGTGFGDEAHVYVKSGNQWGLQRTITNPVTGDFNFFGSSVALSGNTAIIGDPSYPDSDTRSGAVYVYTRIGSTWTQEAIITPLDAKNHDRFGHSVSISDNTIVAGTFFAGAPADRLGSAYVFEKVGNEWTQEAKLKASDEAEWDFFGQTVKISGDTIMVGANRNDDAGETSGNVYVFEKTGIQWTETQKLESSDASRHDGFGSSVFFDGDTLIVGAPGADDDAGIRIGHVYVFSNNGNGWTEDAIIAASDPAFIDGFGRSVSFSGNTLIVGADAKDVPRKGQHAGVAYIFELE